MDVNKVHAEEKLRAEAQGMKEKLLAEEAQRRQDVFPLIEGESPADRWYRYQKWSEDRTKPHYNIVLKYKTPPEL